jgi:4-carboxymuconolactone decarboxylase
MLAEHARYLIRAGTGRKRHDDLDLPFRIIVGGCGGLRRCKAQQHQSGEKARSQLHPKILRSSREISFHGSLATDLYGQMDPMQVIMPVYRRLSRLSRARFDRINRPTAKAVRERNVDTNELYARGLRRRKKMFGEADVEQRMAASGEFGAPLQNIINAYVYGDIWERSGLSDDIRSLVMLGITAASNKPAEFRVHAKGALANGCTREQVQDVLLLVDQPHCRGNLR